MNIVDTYVGDFVCIRHTSASVATNEVGVVDGFSPQRTRVLVKDKRRYVLDNNLVFFQAGLAVVRYEQQRASLVVEEQRLAAPVEQKWGQLRQNPYQES